MSAARTPHTLARLWGTYDLLGVTLHDMAEKHWVGTFAAHNARKDLRVADVNSAVSNFKHAVAHEHLQPTARQQTLDSNHIFCMRREQTREQDLVLF